MSYIGRGRLVIILTGFLVTALAAFVFVFPPEYLRLQDHRIYDALLRKTHNATTTGVPVIVDIDEQSLERFGQWPWPRYRTALLIEKTRLLGAAGIGLDILLPEPDRTSPKVLQEQLRALNVDIEFVNLPAALMDNDTVLANVLAKGPFVLGYNFLFDDQAPSPKKCALHPLNIAFVRSPNAPQAADFLYQAPDVVCNLEVLNRAAHASGFVTTLTDKDGILRRVPLLIQWQGAIYPSLSLATLLQATEISQINLKIGTYGVESMRVGNTVIPLDGKGGLLLHYRGPHNSFAYISAADILEDRLPKDALQGKIAFVGTSASGLKDIRSTPFDPVYPGVEVHATVVDNILSEDFLFQPQWAKGLEIFLVVACGLVTTLFLAWSNAFWALLLSCLGAWAMWAGAAWALNTQGVYVSPLLPMIALIVNFSLLTAIKFWREESEKKFFHSAFSHYVSKSVMEQMVASRDKLSLTGEEKEVTILFSDIRNFTGLSERLSSQQVSELLQTYFTPMSRLIIETGGTLDKFIGDGIMAFWNAPVDIAEHQRLAVRTALDMFTSLDQLNPDFHDRFGFGLRIGVGLHCGTVRVGNMGSQDLFDYTIVGDSVNLASRLEGLTKIYGLHVLVSETVQEACAKDYFFLDIDRVRVKGKTRPVGIYTAYSLEEGQRRQTEFDAYQQALGLYREQHYRRARARFAEIIDRYPAIDLYAVYEERCRHLITDPPGPGWDQVYVHHVK